MSQNIGRGLNQLKMEGREMRVLLTTHGSRGDVEPLVGLAVRLRELGAQVRVCAPPDFTELLARVDLPLVPVGQSILVANHGPAASPAELPRLAAQWIAAHFAAITAAAEDCDALLAAGTMQVSARSVAEKLGIPYAYAHYSPKFLPSPHHTPPAYYNRPLPPDVTDNRVLWEMSLRPINGLIGPEFNNQRTSMGLPPVDDVFGHIQTPQPWLAADPVLGPWQEPTDLDVVQTGAWILPDERPLPAGLEAFLQAGPAPVYASYGSMRAPEDAARVAIEAIRAQGRRVLIGRGWADLDLIDDRDDCFAVGEVNQQALFGRVAAVVHHGGAGTTTTAARAGAPQVIVPQVLDQPYWAARVAALGIGAAHDGPTPTTESLSAALAAALTPQIRTRATAVADTIRTDGTTEAATLLLDEVSRKKQPMSA
jgi:vancomycin aglycone glucosyltransferase